MENQEIRKIPDPVSTSEKKFVSAGFRILVQRILRQTEKLHQMENLGSVRTYGSFVKKTSAGKEMLMDTLVWPDGAGYRVAIIGKNNETGDICGIDCVAISKALTREKTQVQIATGRIEVIEKGEKIARVIDETLLEVLQLIANGNYGNLFGGAPIDMVWIVENYNALNVMDLPLNSKGDAMVQKKIDETTIEQERWLALYGKNGKLGLAPTDNDNFGFEKLIKPNSEKTVDALPISESEYKKLTDSLDSLQGDEI